MGTVKTASKSVEELAAEAEAKAAELRRRAEAERAEAERRHAEWEAERERVTPEFWREWESGFGDRHRGKADAAWQAFEQAVRSGQPGVAEWLQYREAVLWRHRDQVASTQFFRDLEMRRYEARVADIKAVHGEGFLLAQLRPGRDLSADEYRRRVAAFNADVSRVLGEEVPPDRRPGASLAALQQAMPDKPRGAHSERAFAEQDPGGPAGVLAYGEAVGKVTEKIVEERLEQHRAARASALETFLDERVGPAPQDDDGE